MWFPKHLCNKIRIMGDVDNSDNEKLYKYLEKKWVFLNNQFHKDDVYRINTMIEISDTFISESQNGLSINKIIEIIENGDIINGE